MKDVVPNLLICCRFDLAGSKHAKQENERVADNTMMTRRRSKRGRGDEPSTSTGYSVRKQGTLPLTSMTLRANNR
jgi:hypothetical protein